MQTLNKTFYFLWIFALQVKGKAEVSMSYFCLAKFLIDFTE